MGVQLDKEVGFDLVHHVTLASYWTRTGVSAVEKPLVLGPVGGGIDPPFRLFPQLGRRGMLEDASRVLTRKILGRVPPAATAQRRAVVTFAQNEATARRLRGRGRLIVLSNALSADTEKVEFRSQRSRTSSMPDVSSRGKHRFSPCGHFATSAIRPVCCASAATALSRRAWNALPHRWA